MISTEGTLCRDTLRLVQGDKHRRHLVQGYTKIGYRDTLRLVQGDNTEGTLCRDTLRLVQGDTEGTLCRDTLRLVQGDKHRRHLV